MSSQIMYCTRCNTPATPGERFCGECGNNLTVPGSLKPAPGAATPGQQSEGRFSPAPTIADNQLPGVQTQRMPQQQYAPPPTYQQQVQTTTRRQGSSNMGLIAGAIVTLLAAGLAGGYFVFFNKPGGGSGSATPAATAIVAVIPTATADVAAPNPTATGGGLVLATATASQPESTSPANSTDKEATTKVDNAARTMRALSSYYLDINADITQSSTTTRLLVAGNFSKTQAEYKITVGGTSSLLVRTIGDQSFTSSDDGKTWEADTTSTAQSVQFFTQLFDRDTFAIGADDTVESIGMETIEGVQTEHIRVTSNGDRGLLGAGYRGTSDFWIADDPKLAEVVKRTDLDITSTNKDNNKISIIYSDYNKTFTVQKPTVGG